MIRSTFAAIFVVLTFDQASVPAIEGEGLQVGPEFRLVENGPGEGIQHAPHVAFGGDVFLVVWQDMPGGNDADVLAARVTSEGELLDDEPLTLAVGPGS
ncbi:MAG: hypothetical protein JJ992_09845, partial [Planctomycetes bacterium]|nr:hypothetical protein [Planctomycetota bacterium]